MTELKRCELCEFPHYENDYFPVEVLSGVDEDGEGIVMVTMEDKDEGESVSLTFGLEHMEHFIGLLNKMTELTKQRVANWDPSNPG